MFQWGQSIEDTSGYRIDSLSASVGALTHVPVGAEYTQDLTSRLQNRQGPFLSASVGALECSEWWVPRVIEDTFLVTGELRHSLSYFSGGY